MNFKLMGKFLSQISALEFVFMIPALIIALSLGESVAVHAFLLTMAIIAAVTLALWLPCRKGGSGFGVREGMVCCSVAWGILAVLGALPFVFSGVLPRFVDALFETVSGFTTTGASVISGAGIESMPRSVLYWRSFTHWVGGMGVLVFLLALSPGEGGKGFTMHLLRAESPGPDVGKLVPKMKQTARILYLIYIAMSIINLIFLLFGGMNMLDAVCTMFGTAGTGGFGVRSDSLASFSPYIQNVTTVFMFLFGVNFSCYYLILLGNFKSVFKDDELRFYLLLIFASIALIALNVRDLYSTWEETVRHSAFQVGTIMSTSGFSTTDFDLWPAFSKGLLMMLMIFGGCAGSTAGGLKIARAMLLLKSLRRNIRQVLNPRKVQVVRVNGKAVDETVLDNANAYLAAYFVLLVLSYLLVSLDGLSVETNLSGVLACLNNVGPGLGKLGPMCDYSHLSILSKLTLTADMLIGRLEIFPILILFSRTTWKRK